MKSKNIFLFMLFICFFISIVVAADHEGSSDTSDVADIDYSNSNTYDVIEFWDNPDYDSIDWSLVDFEHIPLDKVDQAKIPAEYIKDIPADEIDVSTVLDLTEITSDQWAFGENLNTIDDLSTYPNAIEAVKKLHQGITGLKEIMLDEKHIDGIQYNNGILTNGPIDLDLKKEDLTGVVIRALEEGGFAIGKGDSLGKLEVGEFKLDLEASVDEAIINALGDITLPNHAEVVSELKEAFFKALEDGTDINIDVESLNIGGSAQAEFNLAIDQLQVLKVVVGALGEAGAFKFDFETNVATISNSVIMDDFVTVMDSDFLNNLMSNLDLEKVSENGLINDLESFGFSSDIAINLAGSVLTNLPGQILFRSDHGDFTASTVLTSDGGLKNRYSVGGDTVNLRGNVVVDDELIEIKDVFFLDGESVDITAHFSGNSLGEVIGGMGLEIGSEIGDIGVSFEKFLSDELQGTLKYLTLNEYAELKASMSDSALSELGVTFMRPDGVLKFKAEFDVILDQSVGSKIEIITQDTKVTLNAELSQNRRNIGVQYHKQLDDFGFEAGGGVGNNGVTEVNLGLDIGSINLELNSDLMDTTFHIESDNGHEFKTNVGVGVDINGEITGSAQVKYGKYYASLNPDFLKVGATIGKKSGTDVSLFFSRNNLRSFNRYGRIYDVNNLNNHVFGASITFRI